MANNKEISSKLKHLNTKVKPKKNQETYCGLLADVQYDLLSCKRREDMIKCEVAIFTIILQKT
jgi:hypothetical protein